VCGGDPDYKDYQAIIEGFSPRVRGVIFSAENIKDLKKMAEKLVS